MAHEKMPQCCVKIEHSLRTQQQEVARLARLICRQEERGRRTDGLREQLVKAKRNVEDTKIVVTDHEADHAAVPAWA